MSKPKTIDLGTVKKKAGKNPYFQFDKTIKKIQVTREFEIDGKKIQQVSTLSVNENGYLNNAFINKTEEYFNFKKANNFMKPDQADSACKKLLDAGVSSIFQVKVEDK